MSANEGQVGGDHYVASYQHWDWTTDVRMTGLEYAATKYISRWWKKNGVEDIKKSYHYIEKLLETCREGRSRNWSLHVSPHNQDRIFAEQCFMNFIVSSDIPPAEKGIMHSIANWKTDTDLVVILKEINLLYIDASAGALDALEVAGGATAQGGATSGSTEVATMAEKVGSGNPEAHDYTAGMEEGE